jgi:hypothetical protein
MSEELKRYTTPGLKPLRAECLDDAAFLFAERRARLEFGPPYGHCYECVQGASAQDGNFAEFRAVIGRSRIVPRSTR